eukprot:3468375-Rhodomonas_salina.2
MPSGLSAVSDVACWGAVGNRRWAREESWMRGELGIAPRRSAPVGSHLEVDRGCNPHVRPDRAAHVDHGCDSDLCSAQRNHCMSVEG